MLIFQLYIKAILAIFYIYDVKTFWEIRSYVLEKKICYKGLKIFAKIIRKHYTSGIPISKQINQFYAPHGFYGIFISQYASIGTGVTIFQNVNIISNIEGSPTIGNNCLIGAGAIIVGNIKIGDNVKIGAGAVIAEDIPNNCTVVMNKMRILKHIGI